MNPTRQALNELLMTCPDVVMEHIEQLVEIDAMRDLVATLTPHAGTQLKDELRIKQSLTRAANSITVLRHLVRAAKQSSTPHYFQGGLTNDSHAA